MPASRPDARSLYRATRRATLVSVAVNVALSVVQLAAGLVGRSHGLVADGLHSLSDLFADFIVLLANRHGKNPADSSHPYGHGRIETAATLALALVLSLLGLALMGAAGHRLLDGAPPAPLAGYTLWVALLTLVAKEGLFRFLRRRATELDSPMLMANAWHTRSDALSSLVVLAGIGGSLLGYARTDSVGTLVVAALILRMGAKIGWDAMSELVDSALDAAAVDAIRRTLLATPGVRAVHELRTRRMASRAVVDAHIQVDPRISVSEGHYIAEQARLNVQRAHEAQDVLVHIDSEDDETVDVGHLPGRDRLLAGINAVLAPAAIRPHELTLHYLDGRVEADISIDAEADAARAAAVAALAGALAERVDGLRRVRVRRILH